MKKPRPDDVIVVKAAAGRGDPPGPVWIVRQGNRELARFRDEADALDLAAETAVDDEVDVWLADNDRQTVTLVDGYR